MKLLKFRHIEGSIRFLLVDDAGTTYDLSEAILEAAMAAASRQPYLLKYDAEASAHGLYFDAFIAWASGLPAPPVDIQAGLLEMAGQVAPGPSLATLAERGAQILAPVDSQEIWAAGVTYRRSREARLEESSGADIYARVYEADRPELFFKSNPARVVGPEEELWLRPDCKWLVPEPELVVLADSHVRPIGFTIGNDLTARDLESENPLYLPQAKIWNRACSLGPCVVPVGTIKYPNDLRITCRVLRGSQVAYRGETSTSQMARSLEHLLKYLGRGLSFPNGVMLLTGTGIVPDKDFSLLQGDRVEIEIEGLGTLSNQIERPHEQQF